MFMKNNYNNIEKRLPSIYFSVMLVKITSKRSKKRLKKGGLKKKSDEQEKS